MILKLPFVVFIFILTSSAIFSQSISMRFRTGYGIYDMTDLKQEQKYFSEENKTFKITDSFPPYINYQLQFVTQFKDGLYLLGLFGGYNSTGGRLHNSDYSGEVSFNQYIKSFQFGVLYEYRLIKRSRYSLYFGNQFSFQNNFLEYKLESKFNSESQSESIEFRSLNFTFEPYAAFKYDILPFDIRFEVGYNITLPTEFHLKENSNVNTGFQANWTGLRTSINIGYSF